MKPEEEINDLENAIEKVEKEHEEMRDSLKQLLEHQKDLNKKLYLKAHAKSDMFLSSSYSYGGWKYNDRDSEPVNLDIKDGGYIKNQPDELCAIAMKTILDKLLTWCRHYDYTVMIEYSKNYVYLTLRKENWSIRRILMTEPICTGETWSDINIYELETFIKYAYYKFEELKAKGEQNDM